MDRLPNNDRETRWNKITNLLDWSLERELGTFFFSLFLSLLSLPFTPSARFVDMTYDILIYIPTWA